MNEQHRLTSAAVWLCTLAALPAWAGIQVSGLSTYAEGDATANADTNGAPITQTVSNSDSIQALRFDFSAGGTAALNMLLTTVKTGTHLVLSVRAPLDNKLSVQLIGSNDQPIPCAALCKIDRSAASLDDLGWSRHSLPFTLPTNVTVKAIKLLVDGAAHNKGIAYVRSVQILPYVPSSVYPVTPSPAIGFSSVSAEPAAGAIASMLPAAPIYSGDAFQTLQFAFTGLNQMVSLNMPLLDQGLPSRLDTSYVRFKLNLPAAHPVYLRVVDKDGEVFPFAVNRKQTPPDVQGWTTHVVKLFSHNGAWGGGTLANKRIDLPLKEVRLVVNAAASAAVNGKAYFKDVDLLDHAPSPFETLGAQPYLATNAAVAMPAPMAAASVPTNSPVPAGQDAIRSFRFTPTDGLTAGGMAIGVQVGSRPVAGQTLRFQAKVPRGYDLNFNFNDEQNNTFDVRAIRPLSVVDDAGWVDYAVKLEASGATAISSPIQRLRFIVSAGWINGIVAAHTGAAIPEVETQIRSIYLDEAGPAEHPLDLMAGTPVSADWRAVYPDPLLNTGVAAPVSAASVARDLGFRKIRFEFYWEAVEKVKDANNYDFSPYLGHLTTLLQLTPSIDPVIILDYNNRLYSPTGTANNKDEIADGSTNQTAFLNYVTAAATKLAQTYTAQQASRITFEIWNEQNSDNFWVPLSAGETRSAKANNYAQLLIKATARIKAVNTMFNTNFKIISGGMAQPTYYTQFDTEYLKVVKQANAFGGVDMIGYHPYHHHTPELKAVELAGVAAYFRSEGLTLPFAVTEVGTSSRMGIADGSNPETLGKQARVQLRQVLSSWATNKPLHVLYSLQDNPLAHKIEEQYFGLLDKDGKDKPAAKAIKQLFGFANGRKLEGMVNSSPSRVQAMKFSADDKETVFVAWSDYGTPAEANAITTVLSCNRTAQQPACVTDMVGASLEESCSAIGADSRVRCPVTEAGGPVFVRVARP